MDSTTLDKLCSMSVATLLKSSELPALRAMVEAKGGMNKPILKVSGV
jgi:hypothetical protein